MPSNPLPNPLYFVEQKKSNSKFQTKFEKPFILRDLGKEKKTFNFKEIPYNLSEQHITIHREFTPGNNALSPIHYTGVYLGPGGVTLRIHGYYDQFGEYICAQASLNDLNESLNPNQKKALKKLMEPVKKSHLNSLFSELFNALIAAQDIQKKALNELENESRKGIYTNAYVAQLKKVLEAIKEANRLDFSPNSKLEEIYESILNRVQTKIQLDKQSASKSKRKPLQIAFEPPSAEASVSSSSSATLSKEIKSEAVPILNLDELTEKELYQRLEECPENDINLMLKITKAIDQCEINRMTNLIQAVIDGNLAHLESFLKKSDYLLMSILESTAINYNRLAVYEYLRKQNKFGNLGIYLSPFKSALPLEYESLTGASMTQLGLACFRGHYDLAEVLLDKYDSNPDECFATGIPLIFHLIVTEAPEGIIKAFLVKGNTEIRLQKNINAINCNGSLLLSDNLKEKEAVAYYDNKTPLNIAVHSQYMVATRLLLEHKANPNPEKTDTNPLYDAVLLKNVEAVELLLKHKAAPNNRYKGDTPLNAALSKNHAPIVELLLAKGARSKDLNEKKFDSFAEVTHVEGREVNEEILKAFLKQGHHIDQRQGPAQTTGLHYQCQIGNLEGVKTLLKHAADPNASHMLKTHLDTTIKGSPLSVAANKAKPSEPQYSLIVEELLKKNLLSKTIGRAYKNCLSFECRDKLCTAYYTALNKEGLKAYEDEEYFIAEKKFGKALALDTANTDVEASSIK